MTPKEEVEESIALKRRESRLPMRRTTRPSHTDIKLSTVPAPNEAL